MGGWRACSRGGWPRARAGRPAGLGVRGQSRSMGHLGRGPRTGKTHAGRPTAAAQGMATHRERGTCLSSLGGWAWARRWSRCLMAHLACVPGSAGENAKGKTYSTLTVTRTRSPCPQCQNKGKCIAKEASDATRREHKGRARGLWNERGMFFRVEVSSKYRGYFSRRERENKPKRKIAQPRHHELRVP